MKSDLVKKLLRALVTALGIGLGSVLAFVIVQLNTMAGNPAMSIGALLALYAAFALLLGLGGYLIAPRAIDSITRLIALVERCMDKMTFEQQAGSISGLVGGFIIAALLSQPPPEIPRGRRQQCARQSARFRPAASVLPS